MSTAHGGDLLGGTQTRRSMMGGRSVAPNSNRSATSKNSGNGATEWQVSPGMTIDEAIKRVALQKAKKQASERFFDEHLASLQQCQDDVVSRWSSPSDFEKIDLVCQELLRTNTFTATLKYMERVRSLVDTICQKLTTRAVQEGYEPETPLAQSIIPRGVMQMTSSDGGTAGGAAASRLQQAPNTGTSAKEEDPELRITKSRLEQMGTRAKHLEVALLDTRNRLAALEKKQREEKAKLDKREAQLGETASRQAQKAAELQSMWGQVENSRRSELDLLEKAERAHAELDVLADNLKRQEKFNAILRVKLQATEDKLRKEKKDEQIGEIRMEMAQDEFNELEKDFKCEKHKNLKAVKSKNKEIESLKSKVKEQDKQITELQDKLKAAEQKKPKTNKGGAYAHTMKCNAEVGPAFVTKGSSRNKSSARWRGKAPDNATESKASVVDVGFGSGAIAEGTEEKSDPIEADAQSPEDQHTENKTSEPIG